jgi:hypothetical protein
MIRRITRLAAVLIGPAAIFATILAGTATASVLGNSKGAGIEVSPTRVEIHLNSHGTATQVFEVEDPGTKATLVTIGAEAFHQKNVTGQLAVDTPDLPGSVTGLSWVTATPSVLHLQPGKVVKVTVRVAEPRGASPGQRYVAIMFIANALHKVKSQVATRAAVAGELLIDTPGELRSTASYGLHLPSISWGGPVTMTATVRATGNDYVYLHGSRATEGGKAIKLPDAVTLAGSERTLTASFTPGYGIDHVHWNGQSATIIVLPGTILLILGGLILLSGGALLYLRSLRRHSSSRRHSRRPLAAGGAK